ncbi:hypothetical protein AAHC03_026356 [Spirometra sp. Aus1]
MHFNLSRGSDVHGGSRIGRYDYLPVREGLCVKWDLQNLRRVGLRIFGLVGTQWLRTQAPIFLFVGLTGGLDAGGIFFAPSLPLFSNLRLNGLQPIGPGVASTDFLTNNGPANHTDIYPHTSPPSLTLPGSLGVSNGGVVCSGSSGSSSDPRHFFVDRIYPPFTTIQHSQFLLELLTGWRHRDAIHWVNEDSEYKLSSPERVASMWGQRKNKLTKNKNTLPPALRYYYDCDMISKVHGKRFVYKFICDLKTLLGFSAGELYSLVKRCAEKHFANAPAASSRKRRLSRSLENDSPLDSSGGSAFLSASSPPSDIFLSASSSPVRQQATVPWILTLLSRPPPLLSLRSRNTCKCPASLDDYSANILNRDRGDGDEDYEDDNEDGGTVANDLS